MFGRPVSLSGLHVTDSFDCGRNPLNHYLRKHALRNQDRSNSRTFVLTRRDNRVIAYYTLVGGGVEKSEATEECLSDSGPYPQLPVIILARLAVDIREQGKGLGSAMLKDALERCLVVSENIGFRAILVHAKDEDLRAWYAKFGFVSSPTDPLHLFLNIPTLRKAQKP
jgi:predicted GNAT family N-acyltransferase